MLIQKGLRKQKSLQGEGARLSSRVQAAYNETAHFCLQLVALQWLPCISILSSVHHAEPVKSFKEDVSARQEDSLHQMGQRLFHNPGAAQWT